LNRRTVAERFALRSPSTPHFLDGLHALVAVRAAVFLRHCLGSPFSAFYASSAGRQLSTVGMTEAVIMFFAISFINTAAAQVVIPHGDFGNGFEKYLVAAVTLAVLVFAMWRYFRNRR
jgi:hypothetical protein